MSTLKTAFTHGFVAVLLLVPRHEARSATTQLTDPMQFSSGTTLIDFDSAADGTTANSLFASEGVQFNYDGPGNITVVDPSSSLTPHSEPNVMLAVQSNLSMGTFSRHVNAVFDKPTIEVGAFLGNDQSNLVTSLELAIYDAADALLGTVTVTPNFNGDFDQFLGIRSTVPFTRARFEAIQTANFLSIGLDDFEFLSVPEPSSLLLAAVVGVALLRRRRLHRPTATI